ncbi:MAG: Calx-beta domain-containing protein [Pirellulaceae bacterium]
MSILLRIHRAWSEMTHLRPVRRTKARTLPARQRAAIHLRIGALERRIVLDASGDMLGMGMMDSPEGSPTNCYPQTPPTPIYAFTQSAFDVHEGDDTNISNEVRIHRSGFTSMASSVDVVLSDAASPSPSATAGSDYNNTIVTVNFEPGQTEAHVPIEIFGDTIVERNELLNLTLHAESTSQIGSISDATLTLLNDDTAVLTIDDVVVNEGDGIATFRINSSAPSDAPLSVIVSLHHSTTGNTDVAFSTLEATIPGDSTSTSTTVNVSIRDDLRVEGDETFELHLSSAKVGGTIDPMRVTIGDAVGIGTIGDNDFAVFGFDQATTNVDEDELTRTIGLSLNLITTGTVGTAGLDRDISVDVEVVGGDASASDPEADFTYSTRNFAFAAGTNGTLFHRSFDVAVHEDIVDESQETVEWGFRNLSDASGGQTSIGSAASHHLFINDDDTATTARYDLIPTDGDVLVWANGNRLDFLIGGVVQSSRPIAQIDDLLINGTGDGENVTLDLLQGNIPTSVQFDARGGNDTLSIINPPTGVYDPSGQVQFVGGSGDNRLHLIGGSASGVRHRLADSSSGVVLYNGESTPSIVYSGVSAINDTIVADDRIFDFQGADEVISLGDDGVDDNAMQTIDSPLATEVRFRAPSQSMLINTAAAGGSGADVIEIEGLDASWDADLTVAADGNDIVRFQSHSTDLGTGDLNVEASQIVVDQQIETDDDGMLRLRSSEDIVLTPNGRLHSENGLISAVSQSSLLIGDGARITSLHGDVELHAGSDGTSLIAMSDNSLIDAGSGDVSLRAGGDVTLGGIRTTGNADVTSLRGQIIDGGDLFIDLEIGGHTDMIAEGGIGVTDPIETSLETVDAFVAGTGSIRIAETDEITLSDVESNDGLIEVVAGGDISALSVQSNNLAGVDAATGEADSRDIALIATGPASTILVGHIAAMNGADVDLEAGNDILDTDVTDSGRIRADDLRLIARNQTNDGGDAIKLSTDVNDLRAIVQGSTRGDLEINELNSINLVAGDDASDLDALQTGNGEIRITAGGSITLTDPDRGNEGTDRLLDPEVIAGGLNGRIAIEAGGDLVLGDGVQMHAAQSTVGAVRLTAADAVLMGEQIEINTGGGVGIARLFAPRPGEGVVDPAFYDVDSVSTTILLSEPKGFGGDLSIDLGAAGERGLAVEVDWGAQKGRFEVFDGLDGGVGPQVFHHVYTEEEILVSTLNGRPSSTSPLEVRFAVRHHESIVVQGQSIEQGLSGAEVVPGELLSSTDNPTTRPLLEDGQAQFTVPNLSIPTRLFFPPPEYPELVRRIGEAYFEKTTLLTNTTSTSDTAVVTTTSSRDEYFQIRVISQDPNAPSEVPPERLPDDILSGDNLQKLFAELPDGSYEIQYVLGEGNERSILRVEIRQGKAVIPDEDMDGGKMRLTPLDSESNRLDSETPINAPSAANTIPEASMTTQADASLQPAVPLESTAQPLAATDELDVADSTQEAAEETAAAAAVGVMAGIATRRTIRQASAYSLRNRLARRIAKPLCGTGENEVIHSQ